MVKLELNISLLRLVLQNYIDKPNQDIPQYSEGYMLCMNILKITCFLKNYLIQG